MKNLIIAFAMFLGLITNAASINYLTDTKSSAESESNLKNKFQTVSFVLGYQNTAATVNHVENSNFSNFYSINKSLEVEKSSLDLSVLIEPFQNKRISPTFLLRAGVGFGSDSGALANPGFQYQEKYTEQHFGLGCGFNYNTYGYGLKIQPFVSEQAIYSRSKFGIDYGHKSDPTTQFGIDYKLNEILSQTSAGIRFYDYDLALMSYVSLDYQISISQTSSVQGDYNGQTFAVSNGSVKTLPVGFTVGLGMVF